MSKTSQTVFGAILFLVGIGYVAESAVGRFGGSGTCLIAGGGSIAFGAVVFIMGLRKEPVPEWARTSFTITLLILLSCVYGFVFLTSFKGLASHSAPEVHQQHIVYISLNGFAVLLLLRILYAFLRSRS